MKLSQTGKHWRGSTVEVVGLADECMGTICVQVGVAMVLCQRGLGYAAFFINLLLNFTVSKHTQHACRVTSV